MSLLKEFGMDDMLDMSQLTEINTQELLSGMLKDNEFGIDLSGFDINEYAKMGQAVTVKSKRVLNGETVNITYIKADQTAIMVSLMRYIAEILKNPEADILSSLTEVAGDNPMVSGFVDGIGEDLNNMSIDETVEWIYKIFFRERPIVEEKTEEEYLPTIIYEPEKPSADVYIYSALLLISLCEVIYIKERIRINRYIKRKARSFKQLKKQISQEV
jgi:hypothetical protein